MKALKNESALFTRRITAAIAACYAGNPEPADAELMALYAEIGTCICEQGEKAYVVHLAQTLAEQFPQYKGFSPRNLRRMRDFYRAYENSPALMVRAQSLNWTQNTVVLECCETDEQRAFYICLAAKQNLSKLALMKAIESGAFEAAEAEQNTAEDMAPACAAVGACPTAEAVDATPSTEAACGAFVPTCDPSRQGNDAPTAQGTGGSAADLQRGGNRLKPVSERMLKRIKRSSHAAQRPLELLPKRMGCTIEDSLRMWLGKCLPPSSSPPLRWRQDFAVACRCSA